MGKGRGWGLLRGASTQCFQSVQTVNVLQLPCFCGFTRDFPPLFWRGGQGVRCGSLLNPRSSVSICGSKAVRCWRFFAAFASGFCRPLLSAAIRLNPRPSGLASAGAEKARSLPPLRASGPPPIGGSRPARLRGRWCGIWGTRARPGGCRLLSVFPSAPGCGRRGAVRPGCHG